MSEMAMVNDCWNRIGVRGDVSCPELKELVHCHNCPVYRTAAVTLLDREIPPGSINDYTRRISSPIAEVDAATDTVLAFRIGPEWLAVSSCICQEVAENRVIHSIPFRRDGIVLGLVNIRGELVIAVSLERVLGIPPPLPETERKRTIGLDRLIVIQHRGARFAFPASQVHGLVRHDSSKLEALPRTLDMAITHYSRGLINWNGTSVAWLDHELVFFSLGKGLS